MEMAVPAHGHWPSQLERPCPRQGRRLQMLHVHIRGLDYRGQPYASTTRTGARPRSASESSKSERVQHSSLRGGGPRLTLPPGTIRRMGRERGLGSCNSPLLISPARRARRFAPRPSAQHSVRWGGGGGWALVTHLFSSLQRGGRGGFRLFPSPRQSVGCGGGGVFPGWSRGLGGVSYSLVRGL